MTRYWTLADIPELKDLPATDLAKVRKVVRRKYVRWWPDSALFVAAVALYVAMEGAVAPHLEPVLTGFGYGMLAVVPLLAFIVMHHRMVIARARPDMNEILSSLDVVPRARPEFWVAGLLVIVLMAAAGAYLL